MKIMEKLEKTDCPYLDIFDIDFMPDNPGYNVHLYRSKTSAEGKGIYRSKDGGKNWKQVYKQYRKLKLV